MLDEDALIRALNEKKLAGAALDALATEPLPAASPLWTMPNVIITPHLGGYYDNYPRDAAMQFEKSLEFYKAGKPELMLTARSAARFAIPAAASGSFPLTQVM